VQSEARVNVISRDRPRRVDAGRACGGRARRIEGGEGAVGSAQEAVLPKAGGNVVSRDRSLGIDALGKGKGRLRSIEDCESAFARTHKAVRIVSFKEISSDQSSRVDAVDLCARRTRRIKGDKGPFLSARGKT